MILKYNLFLHLQFLFINYLIVVWQQFCIYA